MKRRTWSGDWPIPKLVVLPGVRVRVRVVNPEDKPKLGECDGMALYSHEKDTCVILIDGTLPLPVQRYVLLHELEHVQNELRDIMLEHYDEYVQTRRMAATQRNYAAEPAAHNS